MVAGNNPMSASQRVSADPSEGSIISMKVREGADVSLWLPAEAMAKLQAMMAQADLKHARSLQPQ